jgi:hypothetical protein
LDLVENDPGFHELEARILQPSRNIFEIICKERDELTFSRVLKYFLDPIEDHHLGDQLLKAFFDLSSSHLKGYDSASQIHLDNHDLSAAKVYREYSAGDFGRIDIVVDSPPNIFVIIEVKLYSSEGDEQTTRYSMWAEQELADNYDEVALLYVTPDGQPAISSRFVPISFADLLYLFEEMDVSRLSEEAGYVYDQYVNWMKRMRPMDSELKQLCREIYSDHKEAVDILIQNAPAISGFMNDLKARLNETYGNLYFPHNGESWVTLSPRKWLEVEELRTTKHYSRVRLEYNLDEQNDELVLSAVYPVDDCCHNLKTSIVKRMKAEKVAPIEPWRADDGDFFRVDSVKDFRIESFVTDWDEQVDKLGSLMVQWAGKLLPVD